ncbi:MAG TPA: hypothetical protein ENK82_00785 [Campylobacterales bacterium]|nr:hypothetical protein [Campylobacterales bacterium]HHS91859.1 hypothetical protein [Campylobacterales bacterium]
MSIDSIIVTTGSFHSHDKQELIDSNTLYVTKLFQHNITEDKFSEDALVSYYIDYYQSHITHGGFYNFVNSFQNHEKILYYIRHSLQTIKSSEHLELLNTIFPTIPSSISQEASKEFDDKFHKIQEEENLTELNFDWLINHPKLNIVPEEDMVSYIKLDLIHAKKEPRHVKIIKQLCKIINEEFVAITAGDRNNIYMHSWHFKTIKNYYYIIEKDHIVTLYNSFTKEEVTKGRLVLNKTEQNFVSTFISQMLA